MAAFGRLRISQCYKTEIIKINYKLLKNVAINDVLSLKAARRDAIAILKMFWGLGHQRPNFDVKVPTLKLSVTLLNLNRFLKFVHCWKAYEIYYKTYTTSPTSPYVCCYTTLLN